MFWTRHGKFNIPETDSLEAVSPEADTIHSQRENFKAKAAESRGARSSVETPWHCRSRREAAAVGKDRTYVTYGADEEFATGTVALPGQQEKFDLTGSEP